MKNIKGYLLAIISSATFGMIPLFTLPVLADGIQPSSVLFYRMFFASIILGIYLIIKRVNMRLNMRQALALFAFAGPCYAFTSLLLLLSYQYMGSGVATTIHFLYPVTVSLIMILFFRERFSLILFFAMIASIAGVVLLSWRPEASMNYYGLALVLGSVFTYAAYIVALNRSSIGKIHPLTLTFYVLFCSTVIFAFNGQLNGGIQTISQWSTGINLLMLGIICTVISNLTLVLAVKETGATIAAALGTMEPLTAVTIGVLYFNETFSLSLLIGVIIIFIAVLLIIFAPAFPAKIIPFSVFNRKSRKENRHK